MTDAKTVEKWERMIAIFDEVIGSDTLVGKFFDVESTQNLDKKIEVLTALRDGARPADIDGYYDILELYPKNGEAWD